MTTFTTDTGAAYSREDQIHQIQNLMLVVTKIVNGEPLPGEIPWTDPDFQRAVCIQLRKMKDYKKDAAKLAVIKEVFGGTK